MTALMAILSGWRVPAQFQRFLAYVIVIGGACLLLWGAWMLGSAMFRGWVQSAKDEAVQRDRIDSKAIGERQKNIAEQRAAADKHADELTAERAKAEQLEAINETAHDPGGDPFAELYKRVR